MRYFCVVHGWDGGLVPCPGCRHSERSRHPSQGAPRLALVADLPLARTRASTLMRAVRAMVEGDATHIDDLFTPDVRTDSPASLASSRVELGAELDERRRSFRQHDIEFRHLDVHGDLARVEWVATGLHVGPFVLERDGTILQPTGLRLRVHAITQATFRGDRICAWRSTWDDVTLLEGEAARDAYA